MQDAKVALMSEIHAEYAANGASERFHALVAEHDAHDRPAPDTVRELPHTD